MVVRRGARRWARRAFTLVELTVVLLVVAILAAVAAPRYASALADYRINAAAQRVASDLRMIRQYARKISQPQSLQFDAAANSYTSSTMSDLNRRGTTSVNLWSSEYVTDITSASFGGNATVQFDIFGRPTASGTVVLVAGGLQRTVEVDEGGNVRIY